MKKKSRRKKTNYPGVYYEEKHNDRYYYIVFRRENSRKQFELAAGRKSKKMTPLKASKLRAEYALGKETPKEQRMQYADAVQITDRNFGKLFDLYCTTRTTGKSLANDVYRFDKYIRPIIGNIEPKDFRIDPHALKTAESLQHLAAQSKRHVWNLILRMSKFDQDMAEPGTIAGLAPSVLSTLRKRKKDFIPLVDNDIPNPDEFLTDTQRQALFEVLDKAANGSLDLPINESLTDEDKERISDEFKLVANMLKLAAYTGIRRGEIIKLCWNDIDFERKNIIIRHDPKGGKQSIIPLNDKAGELLEELKPKSGLDDDDEKVFQISCSLRTIERRATELKNKANLPESVRPFHGLRVNYASSLAASGKVPLDHLQKLLTHKDPRMTQRYKHLRDSALQESSNVINDIF